MFSVAIIYQTPGGRPLQVVAIEDRHLLQRAAAVALAEAVETAKELSEVDPVLGNIQEQEVGKLRNILTALLPSAQNASVM